MLAQIIAQNVQRKIVQDFIFDKNVLMQIFGFTDFRFTNVNSYMCKSSKPCLKASIFLKVL